MSGENFTSVSTMWPEQVNCTMDCVMGSGGLNITLTELSKEEMGEMLHMWAQRYFVYKDIGNILLISCYVPLFLLAAAANTLVIIVVIKYHYMRSVTNYFLVNLSVADLLVTLICMPMAVGLSVTKQWLYGEFMCKFTYYLQAVSVGASVFTLTAMSIDRYLAIRHPMAFRKIFNRTTTIIVIVLLWVVALVIFSPILWVRHISYLDRDIMIGSDTQILGFCYENWESEARPIYGVFCFVFVYAVPGSVVILAYSLMGLRLCAVSPQLDGDEGMASTRQGTRLVRERRRVARILLLLAVMFAFCWLPHNVFALVMDLEVLDLTKGDPLSVFSYTLLLGHANSAINPLLYCFMTRNFRSAVRELVVRSRATLAARQHQRCKIRTPHRSATTSSGYDSYHSPHRRCYVLHTLRRPSSYQYPSNQHGIGASTQTTRVPTMKKEDTNCYL